MPALDACQRPGLPAGRGGLGRYLVTLIALITPVLASVLSSFVPRGHRPTPCRQLDPNLVLFLPAFQTGVGLTQIFNSSRLWAVS